MRLNRRAMGDDRQAVYASREHNCAISRPNSLTDEEIL
jgi:hypothetical protein